MGNPRVDLFGLAETTYLIGYSRSGLSWWYFSCRMWPFSAPLQKGPLTAMQRVRMVAGLILCGALDFPTCIDQLKG